MKQLFLYHIRGKNACKKPAYKFVGKRKPKTGDLMTANDFQYLDGSDVLFGDRIRCDSCKQTQVIFNSADIY